MKKSFFRLIALMLAVLMLTAVLGGCSDGKDAEDSTESESSDSSEENGQNSITVGIAQDLDDSLDPHRTTSAGTREVLFNIFEGLVKPDSDGNIIGAVAETWDVDDTGTVYTFKIREGVQFHNGETVTVDDVVYSIERCSGLSGDDTFSAVTALSAIQSVEATDESTVVITLSETNTEFLANLATTATAIIPKDYDDQDVNPVGTGPFKFVSRSVQENFVMERFDDYWGENALLDSVTYKIITDSTTLVTSLQSGAIDLCAHLSADQAAILEDDFTILEDTMKLVQALYLNNSVEPFNDIRVRQALCYAIDVDEIIDIVCDGRGVAVGSSMFPAFTKYFMEDLSYYYEYDQQKAIDLLVEAGYADGFDMTITVPSNYQQHVDTAVVIKQQLERVGINAEIQEVEWETWKSDVYNGRNFESTVVGFDASTMTASAMLQRWTSDASKNMINFSNEEYDSLYAQALACTDDAEQTALFKQMETILAEQAASVYIQDLCDMVAMRSDLAGLKFYPLYVLDLSTVYIAG